MRNLFLLMTTLFALSLCAQTPKEENVNRNEIRIGVGDPFLDMIFMHTDVGRYEYVNQRFTGNLFVEYQYRINDWLSVGGKATYSAILYDTEYYSSSLHLYENREAVYRNRYSMRASLMPTVRFTYVCKQLVQLYSGAGIGCALSTYNQTDNNNSTLLGVAQVTLLGVAVGNEHWFGAFEITPQVEFCSYNILPYSIFNISLGYRF